MDEESEGLSFLFSKLCEKSFKNEANIGWDIYRRPRYTDKRQKALKVCLYETLFEELRAPWISELVRTGDKAEKKDDLRFNIYDKLSIAAFKLRIARRFDDAEKLDHFVCQWRNLQELSSSAIKFNSTKETNATEKEAVLRFLVALTGTGHYGPTSVLGYQDDVWARGLNQIQKTSLPEGPLLVTDSQLLRQQGLEFDHYVHYSRELFECPPILSVPGSDGSTGKQHIELQIFEEMPGTFPGKALFLPCQDGNEDLYEKNGRSSLFSALVHSHTDDLHVKLDLPDIPSSSRTLHSLALEQRESADDEGFESLETSSESSHTSEQSAQENTDVWSAALTLPPQKFYTWEMEGKRELLNEKPYLTEAGASVFDALYDTVIRQVSYIVKSPTLIPNMVPLQALIKDSINVLIGVPSRTFHLDKAIQSFIVSDQVRLSGTSPEMLRNILARLAAIGTDYIQLNKFATHHRGHSAGLVLQAFLGALQNYLQCYRATVLSVEVSSVQSPMMLSFAFENLGRQLRFLADVCMCSEAFKKAPEDPKPKFPTGVRLLTYLYQLCLEHSSSQSYSILLSLLKHSVQPYIIFIQTWVFKGICNNMFGEFMIEMDEQYLAYRDKHFWTQGFVMVGRDKLDCVPLFLGELADDIFVCGKTINLLKLCCPGHYLCDPGIPLPKMEVTFSMQRLSRIEAECQHYMSEIQRMHRQLQEQRENERKVIEDEREREIVEERERAAKALAEITELIQKAKEAVEEKKREDLKMLKEQMEEAFKHKALAREEEREEDIKRLKAAKDKEVTTATVEEEIKNKAREELIKYYEELSREVEYREFRAQWHIRRRLLDPARAQFFVQEQARLDSLQEQMTQASGTQTSNEITDESDERREKRFEEKSVSKEERASTPLSAPSPSLVSLIASGVKTDALVRAGHTNLGESTQFDRDAGSHSEESASENRVRRTWDSPAESVVELGKMTEAGSGRKTWEAPPDGEVKIASPLPKSHPSDSSIQFAMYSDKRKTSGESETPDYGLHDRNLKTSTPHVGDSSLQNVLYPTTPSNSTLGLDAESVTVVTRPSDVNVRGLVSSHPSDSSAQDILYGNSAMGAASEVRTPSAQGHPSDSTAQYLLNTSGTQEGTISEARSSEHGHPSDSSVSGLLYPDTLDTPNPQTLSYSQHGHPSDSQMTFSHGDGVAQVIQRSSRQNWQHPSDASIQKLLGDIDVLGDSQNTTRGTPPSSVVQDILYPKPDGQSTPAQDILYPREGESEQSNRPVHTRGAPPQSVIQDILYPSGEGAVGEGTRLSTRGQEPAGKIKNILYYVKEKEGETLQPQSRQLEFEDVWLASQVEPLQDNFNVLDQKPLSNLLRGAMGTFPVSQGSDADENDTDAARLMSLPVLLQRSVMAPLLTQISLVNSAIVTYFIQDLHINRHFDLFKKLLFMEDGEFSLSLSNQLFEKLASGVSPREMCSATVMNSIVGKALQVSIYSDTTEHAQNLAFALKNMPEIFKPNEMGTLDFLELRYRVDWPLNIVITEKSVVKYNKVFSFMLRLKRLSWVLRDIWFHLKHVAYSRNVAGSPQLRQLQLFRHEMQHFVHNLEGYLSNQILNVTWSEFQEGLLNVRSLDDLHNQHTDYLRKAIFRSLLSRKAAPVMTIISDLGTLILKLRTQLLASPWQQDPGTGHVTHPAYDIMCNTHKVFKEYSTFLFTVVSKLVRRGYQSHLADFLLRINFNNFYNVE